MQLITTSRLWSYEGYVGAVPGTHMWVYPHERGSQDRKRVLSKDKGCIATAIDDSRSVIGKPIGRGDVSSDGLPYAFTSRLDHEPILVTDRSKGGIKYAESTRLAHVALDSKTDARKGSTTYSW